MKLRMMKPEKGNRRDSEDNCSIVLNKCKKKKKSENDYKQYAQSGCWRLVFNAQKHNVSWAAFHPHQTRRRKTNLRTNLRALSTLNYELWGCLIWLKAFFLLSLHRLLHFQFNYCNLLSELLSLADSTQHEHLFVAIKFCVLKFARRLKICSNVFASLARHKKNCFSVN